METHFIPLLLHGSMRVLAWKVRFKFSSMLRQRGFKVHCMHCSGEGQDYCMGRMQDREVAHSLCSSAGLQHKTAFKGHCARQSW